MGALAALATSMMSFAPMGALAQRGGAVVSMRGSVRVPPTEVVDAVVAVDGPVRIDGMVARDVVALGGDVSVTGTVGGDVVALAGVVRLGPSAQVGGDLISGREPVIAGGAQVRGVVKSVGDARIAAGVGGAGRYLLGWLAMTVSALLLAMVLHWLVPRRMLTAVLSTARRQPGKSLGVGLVMAIVLPVIALAAIITVIGIPFGVAILVAAGLLAFVGFVTAGWILGRYVESRSERGRGWDPRVWVAIGVGILCAVTLIPVVGNLVWILASMVGVGSIAITFYESRRELRPEEGIPSESGPPPSYRGPEEQPLGV